MSYRMKDIRPEMNCSDYPIHVKLRELCLGDVIELTGLDTWNHCVVSDVNNVKDDFASVKVWRPHMSLKVITGRNEQPSVQFEIFSLHYASEVYKVIDNVGSEYTIGDEDEPTQARCPKCGEWSVNLHEHGRCPYEMR